MLEAADEFVGAASMALAELRALDPTEREKPLGRLERLILRGVPLEPSGSSDGRSPDALAKAKGALDEASRQFSRLTLVFGPSSQVATAAEGTVTDLRSAWETLEWWHALSGAAQSPSISRRRELIRRGTQALGEAGLERVASRVPNLELYLPNLVAQLLAGAVISVERPLRQAGEAAAAALDSASSGLQAFSTNVAVALVEPTPRHGYTVQYVVGKDERITTVIRPKRKRFVFLYREKTSAPLRRGKSPVEICRRLRETSGSNCKPAAMDGPTGGRR